MTDYAGCHCLTYVAEELRRLLTKAGSGVLASLRGSTYGTEYDFAYLLVAALLDDPSEQPAGHFDHVRDHVHGSNWRTA